MEAPSLKVRLSLLPPLVLPTPKTLVKPLYRGLQEVSLQGGPLQVINGIMGSHIYGLKNGFPGVISPYLYTHIINYTNYFTPILSGFPAHLVWLMNFSWSTPPCRGSSLHHQVPPTWWRQWGATEDLSFAYSSVGLVPNHWLLESSFWQSSTYEVSFIFQYHTPT